MRKMTMTALALSAIAVVGSACSRQGEARENYRDTTRVVTPSDSVMYRDTTMLRDTTLRDTMRNRPPRDTVPSRTPTRP